MVFKQRICYDTNLLVDLLLIRKRNEVLQQRDNNDDIYASSYSIGTVYYIANQQRKVDNLKFKKFVDGISIITVDSAVIKNALEIAGDNDLEDAIQIAACKQAGITTFATADKKLAKLYSNELKIELIN